MSKLIWRVIITVGFSLSIVPMGTSPTNAQEEVISGVSPIPFGLYSGTETRHLDKLQRVIFLFDKSELLMRFSKDVEQAVQRSDMISAEQQIHEAGELATLATIFADYVRNPAFSQMLGKLRSTADWEPAERPNIQDAETETHQADLDSFGPDPSEIRKALEDEQRLNESLQQKLILADSEIRNLHSRIEQQTAEFATLKTEWQDRLLQEQRRAEDMTRDLGLAEAKLAEREAVRQSEIAATELRLSELRMALNEGQVLYEAALHDASIASAKACNLGPSDPVGQEMPIDKSTGQEPIIVHEIDRKWLTSGHGIPLMAQVPGPTMFAETVRVGIPLHMLAPEAEAGAVTALSGEEAVHSATSLDNPAIQAAEERQSARARILLDNGDISGARLLLERSAAAGDPRSIFLLAETFDPQVLLRRGVRGMSGDRQLARELYARALSLGVSESTERLEALK